FWGEDNCYPSHLWGITIIWDYTKIPPQYLPKIVSSKEATYLFFYSKTWVEAINKESREEIINTRLNDKWTKTILRIDEFFNLSIFNFLPSGISSYYYDFSMEDTLYIPEKELVFLIQNQKLTPTQDFRARIVVFCEDGSLNSSLSQLSQNVIPYKIYILTSGFSTNYWYKIKKVILNLSLDDLRDVKVALIPLKKDNDFDKIGEVPISEKRWGGWIDLKLVKVANYFTLKDYPLSSNDYLREIFKDQDFYTYECLSDFVSKTFCIALKTNASKFKMYPLIVVDFDVLETVLTGDENIDNLTETEIVEPLISSQPKLPPLIESGISLNILKEKKTNWDGRMTTMTLREKPKDDNHLLVYKNGLLLNDEDYILNEKTIIFSEAPLEGDVIVVWYIY
ncbi:MAG: hypothetical protein NZ608_07820, partial [candidate division WOR-3 bacterium]|nr:hypothetical protein [candidate division WOR-3 bacterium]